MKQDSRAVEVIFNRDIAPYRKGQRALVPRAMADDIVAQGVGDFPGLPPPVPLQEKRGLKVRRSLHGD